MRPSSAGTSPTTAARTIPWLRFPARGYAHCRFRWARAMHHPERHGHPGPRALSLRQQYRVWLATYPGGNGSTATADATYTLEITDGEDPDGAGGNPPLAAPGHRAVQQQHRWRQLHAGESLRRGRPGRRGQHPLQGRHRPSQPHALRHQLFLGARRVRQGRLRQPARRVHPFSTPEGHRQQRRGFLLRRHQRHVGRRRTAAGRAQPRESRVADPAQQPPSRPCSCRRKRGYGCPPNRVRDFTSGSREQLDVRDALDPPALRQQHRRLRHPTPLPDHRPQTPSRRRPVSPTSGRAPRLRSSWRGSTTPRPAPRPERPRRRPARSTVQGTTLEQAAAPSTSRTAAASAAA